MKTVSNVNSSESFESYLKMKNDDQKGTKIILCFFILNKKKKMFIQKQAKESHKVISCILGDDLISFNSSVDTNDKGICDYPIGFQIYTKNKKFVLFASSLLIHNRWINFLINFFQLNQINDSSNLLVKNQEQLKKIKNEDNITESSVNTIHEKVTLKSRDLFNSETNNNLLKVNDKIDKYEMIKKNDSLKIDNTLINNNKEISSPEILRRSSGDMSHLLLDKFCIDNLVNLDGSINTSISSFSDTNENLFLVNLNINGNKEKPVMTSKNVEIENKNLINEQKIVKSIYNKPNSSKEIITPVLIKDDSNKLKDHTKDEIKEQFIGTCENKVTLNNEKQRKFDLFKDFNLFWDQELKEINKNIQNFSNINSNEILFHEFTKINENEKSCGKKNKYKSDASLVNVPKLNLKQSNLEKISGVENLHFDMNKHLSSNQLEDKMNNIFEK